MEDKKNESWRVKELMSISKSLFNIQKRQDVRIKKLEEFVLLVSKKLRKHIGNKNQ